MGLYYNQHRYYDPVVESYINQDPTGLGGGGKQKYICDKSHDFH
ncbi:RHS repeat-associated core domain-containing protein [Delftia acidovorans]